MTHLLRPYGELLVAYLKPQRGRALLLAMLLVASIVLQLASPQVVRHFIDIGRQGSPLPELTQTAALFIGVVLGGQLLAAAVLYLGTDVGWAATNLLRADLLAHVLRLDLRFHNTRTPGELIQRVDGDVAALSNFFSQFVVRVLGSMLLVCGIVLVLLWEDWRLGLAICAIAALGMVLLGRLQGIAVPLVKAHRQGFAELTGFWEERLLGTEDIRALGAQPYIMRRHFDLLGVHMRKARLGNTALRIMQSAGELLLAAGTAATFALSAYLLYGGAITIGTVYLVFAYTDLLAWNVLAIATQLDDLQQASAGIERIYELRATASALPDTGHLELPAEAPAVAFENVSFSYGGTMNEERRTTSGTTTSGESSFIAHRSSFDWNLHDISFQIEPGHVLGLLGRTGSGKTTLTRLLFRFYDPQHGAIRLGGTDIKALPVRALRQRIGMVTQEVQLFHASVRDNLTLFNSQIPDACILETIAELGLEPWLRALPAGLDTMLAPGGGGLSAGEAQLLAFTRVFLRDPAVLVLDEASSRLDPATEQLIGRATERLIRGRTAIIIAHRLTTVERVDDILILEDGRIIEQGRRAALRADPDSRFAHLLRTGIGEVLA